MALNTLKCNHLMPLHFKGLSSWKLGKFTLNGQPQRLPKQRSSVCFE